MDRFQSLTGQLTSNRSRRGRCSPVENYGEDKPVVVVANDVIKEDAQPDDSQSSCEIGCIGWDTRTSKCKVMKYYFFRLEQKDHSAKYVEQSFFSARRK